MTTVHSLLKLRFLSSWKIASSIFYLKCKESGTNHSSAVKTLILMIMHFSNNQAGQVLDKSRKC